MEEFQLYLTYLNKNLNEVYNCIQFFKKCEEHVIEFHAVNIWLQILLPSNTSNIKAGYWHNRLQYLLRLCELAFLFIASYQNDDIAKASKDFKDIFFVIKINNHHQK